MAELSNEDGEWLGIQYDRQGVFPSAESINQADVQLVEAQDHEPSVAAMYGTAASGSGPSYPSGSSADGSWSGVGRRLRPAASKFLDKVKGGR